jgi:hypothetical protein
VTYAGSENIREIVPKAWDLPESFPDFTLTHLLGATKRHIIHFSELKHFQDSDVFDPALRTYNHIDFVIEHAIADSDPDPQFLAEGER